MEAVTIELMPRSDSGSSAARRYRSEGLVPSVVYSHGEPSVSVLLSRKDFVHVASQARASQIFSLKSTDKKVDGKVAVVKEVQQDLLHGKLLHVDFQALKEDEEITVRVSFRFTGEATGVKLDGGILTVGTHDLGVRCLPKAIPQELVVDVTSLKIGDSIHAGDITLPQGVKLQDNPEETVVSVVAVRATVEETPAAAAAAEGEVAEAGAEGAAAASAEGAAGAAKADGGKKAEK